MSSLYSSIYAECVGYAFEQCYSSNIAICRKEEGASNEELLQELKQLVDEYEMACEIVEDISTLRWAIEPATIDKIKAAKVLSDAN